MGTCGKTPKSHRKWCMTCEGHVLTEHPAMGLTDVYAAVIPNFPFKPEMHVNYQEAVLRIQDGLPKFRDLLKEAGGCILWLANLCHSLWFRVSSDKSLNSFCVYRYGNYVCDPLAEGINTCRGFWMNPVCENDDKGV